MDLGIDKYSLFPNKIDRLQYFISFINLLAITFIFFLLGDYIFKNNMLQVKITIIFAILCKTFCMDVPRMRSVGLSPWGLVILLIPIANIVMQFSLFLAPPDILLNERQS